MDQAGGERFLHDSQHYPEREAAWQAEFGAQWEARARLVTAFDGLSGATFLVAAAVPILYLAVHSAVWQVVLFLGVLLLLALCGGFGFSALAERFRDPPRPQMPIPDERALHSEPVLLFDQNPEADINPRFVHYRPCDPHDSRDPPDWSKRRKSCFGRDHNCCRLCEAEKDLHTHHVIPRYRRGSHSLQNLIALCAKCHEAQEYYGHDRLIELRRSDPIRESLPISRTGQLELKLPS